MQSDDSHLARQLTLALIACGNCPEKLILKPFHFPF
jgi:hypothetical protein